MELAVFNQQGQDTGRKIALNEEVFGITPNENAVYLDVKQFLANQRQGTHKSKERSEVSGSTRKLHKQKGGGGSRIGDTNSPVLVGGGRVFGPRPRDYRFKLNKKVKDLARRSAWSAKAADGQIIVVDDIKFEAPKTKEFVQFAKSFNLEGKKVLVVTADKNDNLYLAIRNVPGARVMSASDVNTYSILDNVAIIVTESGLAVINNK